MKVRAVLYDFDHTLVDSPLDFAAMRAGVMDRLAAAGICVPDAERKLILEVVDEAAAQLGPEPGEALRKASEDHIRGIELAAAAQAVGVDGVPESLRQMRAQGRQVAIITRNCRAVVEVVLSQVPLEFDLLLCRDDVERVKPHPDHARAALRGLDVVADEAILVGDFRGDIECAKAAGLRSVGVTTGKADAAQLRAAGADHVLASAAELPAWLGAMGW
jgi:phosphoglycolate phosphatase-like HAD superfamily hydrolase